MRFLAAILLSGCVSTQPTPPVAPPAEPVQQTALLEVWQGEVLEDAAILLAIRPSLAGPAPALSLYDSATTGLTSLAGQPSAKDVDKFKGLVLKPDQKELDRLRSEKVDLDKKTDELEAKVEKEKQARIKAESDAAQAREAERLAKIEARKSEAVGLLTKVGAGAVAVGVLALLFGHWLGVSKLTAGVVIGAGLGVAVAAPWLIDLAEMRWIIGGLVGFLCADLLFFVGVKTWRMLRPKPHETPPENQGGV